VAGLSALDHPALVASVFVAAAVALHPGLGASSWLPERDIVVAALLLLAGLALAVRAVEAGPALRLGAGLAALGALAVVFALGFDGVSGHHGSLALAVGQGRGHFDEAGPGGRSLGLRPLGFTIGVEGVRDGQAVDLVFSGDERASLRAGQAVSHGGYRFSDPRMTPTGGAARLHLAVSDGTKATPFDLVPGQPAQAAGLEIGLEQYLPDFALDERQQPFTRSLEPRNPAALLVVRRGGQSYRAFVLQSMPGVHRVETLGVSFSLLGVEPEENVLIAVHREPGASVALAGGLVLALGVTLTGFGAWRSGSKAALADPPLVAGAALAVLLALADRGAVLSWRLAVPTATTGSLPLPGVGVFLGAALLAALLGSLLLLAQHAAGAVASARTAARAALWAAVAVATLGLVVGAVHVAAASDVTADSARPLAGLALAVAVLATALALSSRPRALERTASLVLPLAVALALAVAVRAGVRSLGTDGTYASPAAVTAASAALVGLAALERTGLVAVRRLAFLVALLLPLVRPQ
jgi:hypothetical protein